MGLVAFLALTFGMPLAVARDGKRPDPADSRAPDPGLKFHSAFSDYQPFREQRIRSWKEANRQVADNPGGGSMANMPAMDSRSGDAPKGSAGHAMRSMKGMPGMDKTAAGAPSDKHGHAAMAMNAPHTSAGHPAKARNARLTGTGLVREVDRANRKVKLTHDPIAAMAWPRMTLSFRLKDSSLADRVKVGDRVEFSLEKSVAGYVISALHKSAASPEAKHAK